MIEDAQALAQLYAELGQGLLKPPAGDPTAGIEFTRLFWSPEGAPCLPWQSAHMAAEGEAPRLMGASHHSALDWYRRFGFEPAQSNEPADHLGLLLLFYAKLLSEGVEEATLALYESQHLAWAPRFIATLKAEARHPLYQKLAADLETHL